MIRNVVYKIFCQNCNASYVGQSHAEDFQQEIKNIKEILMKLTKKKISYFRKLNLSMKWIDIILRY